MWKGRWRGGGGEGTVYHMGRDVRRPRVFCFRLSQAETVVSSVAVGCRGIKKIDFGSNSRELFLLSTIPIVGNRKLP